MRTVELEEMRFVGVSSVYESAENDPGFEKVWFRKFMPIVDSLNQLSVDKADYGLQISTADGHLKYFAGVKVAGDIRPIPNTELLVVPATSYILRRTNLEKIGEDWDLFDEQIRSGDIAENIAILRIEQYLYAESRKPEDMRIFLYLPVLSSPVVHNTQTGCDEV